MGGMWVKVNKPILHTHCIIKTYLYIAKNILLKIGVPILLLHNFLNEYSSTTEKKRRKK